MTDDILNLLPLSVEFVDDDGDILSFRLPTDESDVCVVDVHVETGVVLDHECQRMLNLEDARKLRDWLTAWLRKGGKDD